MTFLPVVERELRVAARKRFTYWSRLGAAGFLMGIFGLMFSMVWFGGGFGPVSPGKVIFSIMDWTTFVFVIAWGVFIPADTISEEKRDGTLGLLFLTDLRGYDIVLGKLVPLMLRSFYLVLAVFPMLALPLMLGGVSGVDFGRTALVMVNTLFFSLCIGLFISSISREVLKAMNAALFLNLFFLVGLLWLDWWMAKYNITKWKRIFSTASPAYLFAMAGGLQPKDFWTCLLTQHCIAWSFLAGACVAVPRTWKERTQSQTGFFRSLFGRFRFGGKRKRLAFRKKLLGRAPVLWLTLRDRWLPRQIWIITAMAIGFLAWNVYWRWLNVLTEQHMSGRMSNPRMMHMSSAGSYNLSDLIGSFSPVGHLLNIGLIVWVAMLVCRFYSEAVRSGAMELILVTPMTVREIVRSVWKGLWRTFLFTIIVVLALWITTDANSLWEVWTDSQKGGNEWVKEVIESFCGLVNFLFRLLAVAWFGMWMGLANRKVSVAVIKTVAFGWLLPLLAELFVWIGVNILEHYLAANWSALLMPAWVWALPVPMFELAKNIFLILWARKRVNKRFRDLVVDSERAPKVRVNVLPRTAPPPIIPKPLVT